VIAECNLPKEPCSSIALILGELTMIQFLQEISFLVHHTKNVSERTIEWSKGCKKCQILISGQNASVFVQFLACLYENSKQPDDNFTCDKSREHDPAALHMESPIHECDKDNLSISLQSVVRTVDFDNISKMILNPVLFRHLRESSDPPNSIIYPFITRESPAIITLDTIYQLSG
jgi:hypothetical protein